jgi:hypothetical protein
MAIIFLQAVNAVLKRVGEIAGDSEELATSTVTSTATGLVATDAFTDSRRQHKIDIVIQLWNEAAHEVFRMGRYAQEVASATLILLDGTREYDLPQDFERMAGEHYRTRAMRGATNGRLLYEYPGFYEQMLVDQPTASDFQGDPNFWAISPVQSKIRVDAVPTAAQDQQSYNYLYHKRLQLSSTMATSTLPFSDSVADSLVPVVVEGYNRVMKKEFQPDFYEAAISRSLEFLTQNERRSRWGPYRRR